MKYNDHGRKVIIIFLLVGTVLMYITNNKNPLVIVPAIMLLVTTITEVILSIQFKKRGKK